MVVLDRRKKKTKLGCFFNSKILIPHLFEVWIAFHLNYKNKLFWVFSLHFKTPNQHIMSKCTYISFQKYSIQSSQQNNNSSINYYILKHLASSKASFEERPALLAPPPRSPQKSHWAIKQNITYSLLNVIFKFQVDGFVVFIVSWSVTAPLFPPHRLFETQFTSSRYDWQTVIAMMSNQMVDAVKYVVFRPYLFSQKKKTWHLLVTVQNKHTK